MQHPKEEQKTEELILNWLQNNLLTYIGNWKF